MVFADYHTHTVFSHGTGTPEQNVQAAIQRGLCAVAISEHGPGHLFYGVRGAKLLALRREVDRLAAKYAGQIEVLMGIECNLTGFGRCDLPADPRLPPFDVILLAYHKGVCPRDGLGLACSREAMVGGKANPVRTAEALLAAAEKYAISMFSHPGLYVAADIPTLARGAGELGVLLELNSARVTMTAEQIRQAAAAGASFVIGSDAHSPARVGDFELGLNAAREAGVLGQVANWKEA
ncbi:MAG: PHP domain-containing protein [Candidatus Pelethousia sp.]|nr:PHP domain-containing protein [Candidatus Pelethousia sp.]